MVQIRLKNYWYIWRRQNVLFQAGEHLRNQAGEHGISAQALLEAKNELLAMRQVNQVRSFFLSTALKGIKSKDVDESTINTI